MCRFMQSYQKILLNELIIKYTIFFLMHKKKLLNSHIFFFFPKNVPKNRVKILKKMGNLEGCVNK